MGKQVAVLLFALALIPLTVRADDYGPARTVAEIRADARRLLARQARAAGVDPKEIAVTDVVAGQTKALLSWDFAKQHGLMGLVRSDDRWWDAWDSVKSGGCWDSRATYPFLDGSSFYPGDSRDAGYRPDPAAAVLAGAFGDDLAAAAAVHNADVRASTALWLNINPPGSGHLAKTVGCQGEGYSVAQDALIHSSGATIAPPRAQTSGYALTLAYAANDASSARVKQIYVRPPTPAEFLPNHAIAPGWGYSNAVCFFDIAVDGSKPVDFKPGTVIDVWFPFVLDDQLQYSLSFFSNDKPSGLIKGTIFDNTVHFVLPEMTLAPGKPLMAEIDGDPMSSR